MSTPVRLVGFALVVLLGLGGGYAVGAAVGPIDTAGTPAHGSNPSPTSAPTTSAASSATASTVHDSEHGS
jgi:hypothetical protein